MRKRVTIAAGAYLLIAGLALGQQWTQQARVYVPFDFAIGETVLPAGTYTVNTRPAESTSLLMFTNTETGAGAYATNIDISVKGNLYSENSNLVFVLDASGRHILHQVWIMGDSHGHDLLHEKGLPEPR